MHLLAAGLWAGGIAALAVLRPPGGWRSTDARVLLARFTPVALGAFGVTVVAGGLEAIAQLGSIQALFGTAYGRVLLVKMALVALMLPLSAMAWRLKRPHVRVEAALAACGRSVRRPFFRRFQRHQQRPPGRSPKTQPPVPPRGCPAATSSPWRAPRAATSSASACRRDFPG